MKNLLKRLRCVWNILRYRDYIAITKIRKNDDDDEICVTFVNTIYPAYVDIQAIITLAQDIAKRENLIKETCVLLGISQEILQRDLENCE